MNDSDDRSPAIIVSGTIRIDPDQTDRARELVAPLVAATRVEPGNISYGFYADLDEPGRFQLYEEWESEAAIEAHSASDHLATFYGAIGELDVRHIVLQRHDVTGTRPL